MKKIFMYLTMAFAVSVVFAEGDKYKDYTITGPYTHKNLSVFLVHGKDAFAGKDFLTLAEALDKKKFVVYETGDVNQLQVENKSRTEKVFIQSGDIIKGGRQDRVIQKDLIIKPMSGKLDISVFCVEAERWEGRGQEASGTFSASEAQLPSKTLKLAANDAYAGNPGNTETYAAAPQEAVWGAVAKTQQGLSTNLGKDVRSKKSESSLMLALEDKDLRKLEREYADDINGQIKEDKDAVGYVFAINGEINSGDIYGNNALFMKQWDKLVNSCSTEAISEKDKGKASKSLEPADITQWLAGVDKIKAVQKPVNKDNVDVEQSSPAAFSMESYEKDAPKVMLHKEIIKK